MLSSRVVDGESEARVAGGEVLQWVFANDGTVPWPVGSTLRLVGGPMLLAPVVEVPAVAPGQTVCVDLEAESPEEPMGVFYSLVTPEGAAFGEIVHATITPKIAAAPPRPVVVVLASPMDGREGGLEALQGEVKTVEWTLANAGSVPWPEDTTITLVYNTPGFEHLPCKIEVPALGPGMTVHAGVSALMPEQEGLWRAMWVLMSPTCPDFGEILLAEFAVSDFPFMDWMLAEEALVDSASDSPAQEEAAPRAKLSMSIAMQRHTFLGVGEVEDAGAAEEWGGHESLGRVSGVPGGSSWVMELLLTNDGSEAWPAGAALTCCFGSGFGCGGIDLVGEGVQVGETVSVQMELVAPEAPSTTAWALTIGNVCIGPAMILEVA